MHSVDKKTLLMSVSMQFLLEQSHQCAVCGSAVWSYCCLFPVDYILSIISGDLEWHGISHRSLLMEQ